MIIKVSVVVKGRNLDYTPSSRGGTLTATKEDKRIFNTFISLVVPLLTLDNSNNRFRTYCKTVNCLAEVGVQRPRHAGANDLAGYIGT